MTIIVVNEAEGEVVIFRRETEGVFGDEVAVGDAGSAVGAGDGADGIGGGDEITLGIVGIGGAVVASIDGGHAAVERVDLEAVGHARGVHSLDQLAESVGLDVWIGAGGQQGGALRIIPEGTGLVTTNIHGDLIEGVGDGEAGKLGIGGLRQGRDVRVGAGLNGNLLLPHVAIAQKILSFALLFAPDLTDGLREGGLLARYSIGIGLHGLPHRADLARAAIAVVGRQRFQRGAVRAGTDLADGLPEKVLLRLQTIYYTHAYASYENGSI